MKRTLLIIVSLVFISAKFTNAAELPVITVALVSPNWSTGLPTAVARRAGFFRNEGLEVRPVTLASSGPIRMALLMSGQAEMVIAGGVAILRGIAPGAPVVVVGGHLSRMSYALINAKGLKTVNDLKGKAIGITGLAA
jgi:ABC-type nitrate/sulfonate/bicarbonate transport system substrate-binding protein